MKFSLFIDKSREEEVMVFAHEKNELIEDIEKLVSAQNHTLIGYTDNEAVVIDTSKAECFIVESNKVFVVTEDGKFRLKERLYQIEKILPGHFIKINQSCICNIRSIRKFDVSISGSLTVIFKSGYRDYVSRRNVKNVKERLGI